MRAEVFVNPFEEAEAAVARERAEASGKAAAKVGKFSFDDGDDL